MLKAILVASTLTLGLVANAQAGCLTGAAVGGVVGHMAGHHGLAGAAAGCAIGHHSAKVKQERQDSQNMQTNQSQNH